MNKEEISFKGQENVTLYGYKVWPDKEVAIKGIVQIAHGMAEASHRYEALAYQLAEAGYGVYTYDHRGHGKSAGSKDKIGILSQRDGFNHLVEDMYTLTKHIREQFPKEKVFLLAHSMGSFAAQAYVRKYSKAIDGLILSGSNGETGFMLDLGLLLTKYEVKKHGREARAPKLDKLIFGSYNKSFEGRTSFDWLSRDQKEVDLYIADPYCGEVFTNGFFEDFLGGLKALRNKETLEQVRKDLPIYILAGDKDPVGEKGKGIRRLEASYQKVGIKDVTCDLYEGGRHEMFNEINKKEVVQNVIKWLNAHV